MNFDELIKVGKRLMSNMDKRESSRVTVLRSQIVRQKPHVDMDKRIFLNELLKMLAYADMYFKSQ